MPQFVSAFKQQRLPAWQPVLTPQTVLPIFFTIGIAFIPIGIILMYFSEEIQEKVIDYTHCSKTEVKPVGLANSALTCAKIIKEANDTSNKTQSCICVIPFELESDYKGTVFMYYALSNFYQNHRRYVKSRDDDQLVGRLEYPPSPECEPFAYNEGQPIAPCGAIANSFFSDELTLKKLNEKTKEFVDVPLLRTGIAWESDKSIKFKNPPGDLKEAFKNFSKPKAWKKHIWELDTKDSNNNGFQNEDFMVWMRTAALPNFRKLYRRIDHSKEGYKDGLRKGSYQLFVNYSYDVSSFDSSKRMILSTTSILGGKNPFLGIAYIVVGCICLLLGITLLFIHLKCGKRLVVDVDADKKRWKNHDMLFLKEYVNLYKLSGSCEL